MGAKKIKYLLVFVSPAIICLSMYFGGIYVFIAPLYVFFMIPIMEFFIAGSNKNLDKMEEEIVKNDPYYDYLLYSLVPLQVLLLIYFLFRIDNALMPAWEKIGMMIAFSLSCASLGINGAHELGHRSTWYEQLFSKILLASTQYLHFFIEHNRGHHKNVSTENDPASSRYGETLYAFYVRSVKDSWFSAWKLEGDRLKKANISFWSVHNEMLLYQLIQAAILLTIAIVFSWQVMLWYLGASVMGFLFLETVNYIEHYGLQRKKVDGAYYEKTMPIHSWNSNHTLGRILLLELTRHSDHHYMANRKYQVLRHFDASPQMPAGYPAMMLLAFVPPLWFKIMHRQIAKYKATKEGMALA